MSNRTCSVDGCEAKHYGKGLCRKCYYKAYYVARRDRIKELSDAWYAENKARKALTVAAWQQANPEKVSATSQKHYQLNRTEVLARHASWVQANRARVAAYDGQQRANGGGDLTAAQWLEILEAAGGACYYCGRTDRKLEIEHMTPLSRGGRHTAANIVAACGFCNRSKGRLTAEEFLAAQTIRSA